MRRKFFAASAVLIFAGALGFYKSSTSFNGLVYIPNLGESRMPASVPRGLNFSYLQGSALREASQKRLVSDLKIWPEENRVGIQLGHFITKGGDGRPMLACEFYDRVMLDFQGEGSAENGEKPLMQIEAPCHESQDLAKMQTLWIPVAKFTLEKPHDQEMQILDGSDELKFKFSQMGSDWPKTWSLHSVRLFKDAVGASSEASVGASSDKREIIVSGREIREFRSQPVIIRW